MLVTVNLEIITCIMWLVFTFIELHCDVLSFFSAMFLCINLKCSTYNF